MKMIVTGGAGFIGSNLVERLLKGGHEVHVVDNLHTGKKANLEGLGCKFYQKNAGKIAKIGVKADVVFHQGVYSSSPMYNEDRMLMAKAVEDFISILEYCRENKARLVWASTSSLYNGIKPPHREDCVPFAKDFYTEPRLMMERVAQIYSRRFGVKAVGLRYFSVYGPKEKGKGKFANLISQFLWDMLEDKAPVIYGNGEQRRDFCFVEDVVEANILASKASVDFGIYNIGTGKNYSLNELVALLNKKLGKKIKAGYVENKVRDYVDATLADTSKAKKELGFEAKVSLDAGIGKLIEYYKR